jgi:hypothetical protein
MTKQILYNQCAGINNKVDPTDLRIGELCDLSTGEDILIDKFGKIVSARGNSLVASGNYHSGFDLENNSFLAALDYATGSALYICIPDTSGAITLTGIRSGMTRGARISYRWVDGRVYYMNGFEKGIINDNNRSVDWTVSEWPRETEDVYLPTPTGKFFDIISGCFVIASGNEIIWTEAGMWGIVNENTSWERLESEIRMVYSVGTGMYISDSKAVYWCAGMNPNEWTFRKVLDYPAIPYKRHSKLVNPILYGFQTSAPSALFGTVYGPVIGLPDGSVFNLVDKRVTMPKDYSRGGLMVVDETMIILSGV